MNKQKGLIIGMILIILAGAFSLRKLVFATDLSELQFANSADLEFYEKNIAEFPVYEEGVILILEKENGFQELTDYQWIADFTATLSTYEEINEVSSITNLQIPRKSLIGPLYKPYIDLSSEENFQHWLTDYQAFEDINQKYISSDKRFILCYLSTEQGLNPAHIEEIEKLSQQHESIDISILQQNLTAEKLKEEWINETALIAIICIGLILISFFYFTHSVKALGLILFVIFFNISGTLLFMVGMKIDFNIQMVALPCLIILFSFSDVLHILYHHARYVQERMTTAELQLKLKSNLKTALFLTSFSNLFGFLIFFGLSDNQLLKELAMVALFSVAIAYFCGRYLVIHLLNSNTSFISLKKINQVQLRTNQLIDFLKINKWVSFYSLVLLVLIALFAVKNEFKIDTKKDEFHTANASLNLSRDILTNEFYGSKSIEIAIHYPDSSSIWTLENLNVIESLENEIKKRFNARYTVSPVTIAKRYNRYLVNGIPAAYRLPPVISDETASALNTHYSLLGGDQVIAPAALKGRILIGLDDFGLAESLATYKKIESLLMDSNYASLELKLTGPSYLSDLGTYHFSKNLIIAWLIATFLSSLILMIYLRSFIKGIIILLVNILPVLLVIYLMPYFGLNINPQSLFLLTILAGLCVDDSIYLILNRVSKRSDLSYFPIVVTSIVLAAGFLAFGFSSYSWLSPYAILFVIGISLALILDVFIVPLFMFKPAPRHE